MFETWGSFPTLSNIVVIVAWTCGIGDGGPIGGVEDDLLPVAGHLRGGGLEQVEGLGRLGVGEREVVGVGGAHGTGHENGADQRGQPQQQHDLAMTDAPGGEGLHVWEYLGFGVGGGPVGHRRGASGWAPTILAARPVRAVVRESGPRHCRPSAIGLATWPACVRPGVAAVDHVADGRPPTAWSPFAGAFNFRDLGGYPTAERALIRWGRLFRSDTLHELTAVDVEVLRSLGLATIIDLRTARELERTGRGPLATEPSPSATCRSSGRASGEADGRSRLPRVDDLSERYLWYLDSGP